MTTVLSAISISPLSLRTAFPVASFPTDSAGDRLSQQILNAVQLGIHVVQPHFHIGKPLGQT